MRFKVFGVLALIVSSNSLANQGWEISIGTGSALNLQESINIEMDNGEEIQSESVSFDTKPFRSPLYYNFRVGRWEQNRALEVELIHHKLYAKSSELNSRVQNFEMTDGYNLLYVNYALSLAPSWNTRIGIGPVIAHPDVTVDGVRTHGGYQLSGISAQLAMEREFVLAPNLLFSLEGKMTYSYAEVDLDYGKVTVPNTALHLIGQFKLRL